jgi:hypothetical protein
MAEELRREQVVGQKLVEICHSQYSEPEFIVQGIGPASFRSHFLTLENGVVAQLSVTAITAGEIPADPMPAETNGIPPNELVGRKVAAVLSDDTDGPVIILEGGIYLIDANDAFYGNPLEAKPIDDYEKLRAYYGDAERANFRDYWTGRPFAREILERL